MQDEPRGLEVGTMGVGTVVRDRKWGGRYTGTVAVRDGRWIVVAWHGTFVQDELDADEVDIWAGAPSDLADWRGGMCVLDRDGSFAVDAVAVR
ncbi:MAG: hypothetical protein ACYDAQ_01375 [Mycobacteriales bacterium]